MANHLPEELATKSALVEAARRRLSSRIKELRLEDCGQDMGAGSPKRVIVDTARELDVDLIVMETHGNRGLDRIVGSTTRGVLHDAPCDALVVHMDGNIPVPWRSAGAPGAKLPGRVTGSLSDRTNPNF